MGIKDHYVASIKGKILGLLPETNVVDISHNVSPFNISEAAFMVRNVFNDFPKGTVHIIGVDTESIKKRNYLACEYDGQYFLAADNGIFTLIFPKKLDKVVEINLKQDTDKLSFPTKNVLAEAACFLARGGTLEFLGKAITSFEEKYPIMPSMQGNVLTGHVIYVDSNGNVVTNIEKVYFDQIGRGRKFHLFFGSRRDSIKTISTSYCDVPEGDRLAIFTSNDYLQIAINKGVTNYGGGVAQLFGLKVSNSVRIEFDDNTDS